MKNIFGLVLVASILMLPSCEIPTDLNDNPNEITLQDVDPNLFLNGAQLANIMVQNSGLYISIFKHLWIFIING